MDPKLQGFKYSEEELSTYEALRVLTLTVDSVVPRMPNTYNMTPVPFILDLVRLKKFMAHLRLEKNAYNTVTGSCLFLDACLYQAPPDVILFLLDADKSPAKHQEALRRETVRVTEKGENALHLIARNEGFLRRGDEIKMLWHRWVLALLLDQGGMWRLVNSPSLVRCPLTGECDTPLDSALKKGANYAIVSFVCAGAFVKGRMICDPEEMAPGVKVLLRETHLHQCMIRELVRDMRPVMYLFHSNIRGIFAPNVCLTIAYCLCGVQPRRAISRSALAMFDEVVAARPLSQSRTTFGCKTREDFTTRLFRVAIGSQ
jgi:hypothetical protein